MNRCETEQSLCTVSYTHLDVYKRQVIDSATAVQNPSNTTIAELSGSATADSVYKNELEYAWSVVEQPEGGNAIIANVDQKDALMKASAEGTYTLRLTVTDKKSTVFDEDVSANQDVVVEMKGAVDGVERTGAIITQVGTAPVSYTHLVSMDVQNMEFSFD